MPTTTMSPFEIKLREEVREQLERELRDAMKAEAERRITSAQDAAEQWHRDAMAKYQKDVEADIDFRIEQESEARWQARRDSFLDRLEDLKERLSATEERAVTLEAGLRALTTAIWPEEDKYRAVARHMAITELDLGALAPALALLGWRLGAKTTDSQHSVMLLMPPDGAKAVHLLARKRDLPRTTDPRQGETPVDAAQ